MLVSQLEAGIDHVAHFFWSHAPKSARHRGHDGFVVIQQESVPNFSLRLAASEEIIRGPAAGDGEKRGTDDGEKRGTNDGEQSHHR